MGLVLVPFARQVRSKAWLFPSGHFGRNPLPRTSFPRKRESTLPTFGDALSINWICVRGNGRGFENDAIPDETTAMGFFFLNPPLRSFRLGLFTLSVEICCMGACFL